MYTVCNQLQDLEFDSLHCWKPVKCKRLTLAERGRNRRFKNKWWWWWWWWWDCLWSTLIMVQTLEFDVRDALLHSKFSELVWLRWCKIGQSCNSQSLWRQMSESGFVLHCHWEIGILYLAPRAHIWYFWYHFGTPGHRHKGLLPSTPLTTPLLQAATQSSGLYSFA